MIDGEAGHLSGELGQSKQSKQVICISKPELFSKFNIKLASVSLSLLSLPLSLLFSSILVSPVSIAHTRVLAICLTTPLREKPAISMNGATYHISHTNFFVPVSLQNSEIKRNPAPEKESTRQLRTHYEAPRKSKILHFLIISFPGLFGSSHFCFTRDSPLSDCSFSLFSLSSLFLFLFLCLRASGE